MRKIYLGECVAPRSKLLLPLEMLSQTLALLAKRGAGKTHTASVIAEEFLKAGQQIIVFDPTGAWWGLKASKDGKSAGYAVLIVGGRHADLPIQPGSARVLVEAIVSQRISVIVDTSTMRKGTMRQFAVEFFEALQELNSQPVHLFIDEADVVCPQRVMGDVARLVGAVEDIVKRGRIKGIGCTLITQRPASLNKDALTQCEILIALQLGHHLDIDAIKEWVKVHASTREAEEMVLSLPSLQRGEGWIWSPSWAQIFARIKIRDRETFDSSATPKVGETAVTPKKLAEVDVDKLGTEMKRFAEEAKASDPKALQARVKELQAKLAAAEAKPTVLPAAPVDVAATVAAAVRKAAAARDRYWMGIIEAANKRLAFAMERLSPVSLPAVGDDGVADIPVKSPTVKQVRTAATPVAKPEPPKVAATTRPGPSTYMPPPRAVTNPGQRRILTALAQRPNGLTRKQMAIRAGMSQSGTFNGYCAFFLSSGWATADNGVMQITESGLAALGEYEPLPTGRGLAEHWIAHFNGSGAGRILEHLVAVYPEPKTRAELADAIGMSQSGTFNGYCADLQKLELVQSSRGQMVASNEFFQTE